MNKTGTQKSSLEQKALRDILRNEEAQRILVVCKLEVSKTEAIKFLERERERILDPRYGLERQRKKATDVIDRAFKLLQREKTW